LNTFSLSMSPILCHSKSKLDKLPYFLNRITL
jgi:hypothetical protein